MSQESIEKSAEDVAQLVQEEGLNCLINNAGINVVADFNTVTAEKMIENFHTNAVASLMITKVRFLIDSGLCACVQGVSHQTTKQGYDASVVTASEKHEKERHVCFLLSPGSVICSLLQA